MRFLGLLLILCISFLARQSVAADLSGTRNIWLSNADGERQQIGTITFSPAGSGRTRFKITMSDRLEEYFLAMRPFRCLTGPVQRLCHFPVEREDPLVSADDLVPVEYALMFMRTPPKSLHIDPFNGIYYKMAWEESRIVGRLHDVDMDPFITPDAVPADRRRRPLNSADLTPGDPRSHWFSILTID